MPLPSINPKTTKAWKQLAEHFNELEDTHLNELFEKDPTRVKKLSISWEDFYVDFSKNKITDKTLSLLLQLAEEVKLKEGIAAQFSEEKINVTEDRAVLHKALRDFDAMKPEVKTALAKMKSFSEAIIYGTHKGYTGKPIKTIVNIGIGGSDLGPAMVTKALQFYRNHLDVQYISNVDGDYFLDSLQKLDRETTLFIIVSKTFTTQETLSNATVARNWFIEKAPEIEIEKHFVAVSTNSEAVASFGIATTSIFPMWEWVGGRFSLWSAVGLSTCCAIGYTHFEELLRGAHKMDVHFKETPFHNNIPVLFGMLGVWYTNFFNAETEAIIPYSQYLDLFVSYLQQLTMESNGKSIDRNGEKVNYQTGAVLWGGVGTNVQHAFFQLIHQGTKLIPLDFICFKAPLHNDNTQQAKLLANCFAQTEALMEGRSNADNLHGNFEGNKPSTTLLIKKLTPSSLGKLIALYEHKVFVQGAVWNIFSFDQWGVELGKTVEKKIGNAIQAKDTASIHNPSTKKLLEG